MHRVGMQEMGCSRLNESPSEKEGKFMSGFSWMTAEQASMKVPPKRKGNSLASSSQPLTSQPQ